MIHRDGRWHVFFQHNPSAAVHTDIHWGHVSSDDLVSWREHPVAFAPTPSGPDQTGCWSGVCLDLGDRVAALYTGIATTPVESNVCLRYASDPDLDEWSPPVVAPWSRRSPRAVRRSARCATRSSSRGRAAGGRCSAPA
jgi:beta-fructofuranosidase